MHEEASTEQLKAKSKRAKAPPSLSIPDSADIFNVEVLNRPPSVPIMGRRLSSESLLHHREDSPLTRSKVAFRKYRRKSIPDRLGKKPPIRKTEFKGKLVAKSSDLKPPLDKQGKMLQLKSAKNLIKKSDQSTPHVSKSRPKFSKLQISELPFQRKLDNNTPNKMTRKNSDGKESEEFKKSLNEMKNFIIKYEESDKVLKPGHKASRSVLSVRNEEKCLKKGKKGQGNRISPPKKRTRKKVEHEKSNSHSKVKRSKEVKGTSAKRKTSTEAVKKVVKGKVKATNGVKKGLKKICKDGKARNKSGERWLDHNFSVNTKGKQVDSLEIGENFEEHIQVNGSDLHTSNDLQLSIPSNEDRLSKISSIPGLSLPDSIRPRSPIPLDCLEKCSKIKLIKKLKPKILTPASAALKIQKYFRGYLVRRAINQYKSFAPPGPGFISIDNRFKILANSDSLNNLNFSEDEEVNKIFKEMQNKDQCPEQNFSFEDFNAVYEENIDKSDYQAPKPAEIQTKSRNSPRVSNFPLSMQDLPLAIFKDPKLNDLEKDSKEFESLIYLDSLKIKKANIEDLRKRDLEAIKKLTPKSGSESEIFQIFQNIINRRYETINSMFDDNIKAVQEALAQSFISEDSFTIKPEHKSEAKDFPLQTTSIAFIPSRSKSEDFPLQMTEEVSVKSVNFNNLNTLSNSNTTRPSPQLETRFYRNLEKPVNESRPKSPELVSPNLWFGSNPIQMTQISTSPEPVLCYFPQNSNLEAKPSKIVWIDEVAMPSNIDLTNLMIESCISELYSVIFDDILYKLFEFSSIMIVDLSEELIFAMLSHEVQEKVLEMKKDFDEEAILNVIQKIFIKTQDLIVSELLKPLEKDPNVVLAEIQEAEIGCGFLPEEKYAMLNSEAFNEDLMHENEAIRIFNTMVFDCINECLEKLIVKEDLPWASERYKRAVVKTSEDAINYIVNRLVRFNEIAAGEIGFDFNRGDVEVLQKREMDIMKMMAVDVGDEEADWVRYDKEELQAKLDLADMILEQEIDDIFNMVF